MELGDIRWRSGEIVIRGKGRMLDQMPLVSDVGEALAAYVRDDRGVSSSRRVFLRTWAPRVGLSRQAGKPEDLFFPSSAGRRMSADALQRLVAKHVATARRTCPSLNGKTVTPHTLRHGAAMALLQRGVDRSVIALWLGHESSETTQIYLHAGMRLKEKALAHATPSNAVPDRFRPTDALLAFLESL